MSRSLSLFLKRFVNLTQENCQNLFRSSLLVLLPIDGKWERKLLIVFTRVHIEGYESFFELDLLLGIAGKPHKSIEVLQCIL